MLSGMLLKLGLVTVVLAAVFRIGWSVSAPQVSEPLQPAALQESIRHSLESMAPPLPVTKPNAPTDRRQEHAASQRPADIALDLNRASAQEIERLPGIGPVLAGRIIEYRASQGMFHDIEELRQIKGIGPKKFEQIRRRVAVVPAGVSKGLRKAA